jgi:hypothetical protein
LHNGCRSDRQCHFVIFPTKARAVLLLVRKNQREEPVVPEVGNIEIERILNQPLNIKQRQKFQLDVDVRNKLNAVIVNWVVEVALCCVLREDLLPVEANPRNWLLSLPAPPIVVVFEHTQVILGDPLIAVLQVGRVILCFLQSGLASSRCLNHFPECRRRQREQ